MISNLQQLLLPFASFARYGFRKTIVDRGMLFADFVLATALPYILQFLIWSLIFAESGSPIETLSFTRLMFYYAFAIAIGRLNNAYNTVESVSYALAEGSFDTALLKPLALPLQKLGEFVGQGALYWIPIIGLIFLRHYSATESAVTLIDCSAALLMFVLTHILCFLLGFLLSLIAFWLERGEFILTLLSTAAGFFGGTLLPPNLWPPWLQPIMQHNRFAI